MAVKCLLILESLPVSFKWLPSYLSWEIQVVGMCQRSFTCAGLIGHKGLGWRGDFWPCLTMFWHFNMVLNFSPHQTSSVTPSTSSNFTSSCGTWVYERALSVKVFSFLAAWFLPAQTSHKAWKELMQNLNVQMHKEFTPYWKCLSILNQIFMDK